MENAFGDTQSVTAIFDDAPKAERAVAWLLNIGLQESQIQQTAMPVPGQVRQTDAPSSTHRKQRRSFVDALVDFVLPDDNPKTASESVASGGPRRVTVTDIPAAKHDAVVSILSDEGKVEVRTPTVGMPDARNIQGLIGACLVDYGSGQLLGSEGGGKIDIDLVATLNTTFMRTWNSTVDQLNLDEPLDEILMTLGTQVHLLRPLKQHPSTLLYVALDKATCSLGMARIQLKNIEANLAI